MLVRLRVEVPDRPGWLGRVTWTLGVLGADVVQISVLERDAGRALDDITLDWPALPRGRLVSALQAVPGVRPVGVWGARSAPESLPEVDVVAQMVSNPRRALVILTDAAPVLFAASWACVSDETGQIHTSSPGAPANPRLPDGVPPRVVAVSDGPRLARAPVGEGLVLTVARDEGPAFHRSELHRLDRMLEVLDALPHEDDGVGSSGEALVAGRPA